MNPLLRALGLCTLVASTLVAAPASPPESATTNSPATSAGTNSVKRFYGPVSKVNQEKKTFTVGDQTFTVTPETKMTTKDGTKATLADAVVGEPARGTYAITNSTLLVDKVRFGKKAGGKAGGSGKKGGKKPETSTTP